MSMQNVLKDIIRSTIAPAFKLNGFKKSGNNFYKHLSELGWCVQVELNKWNTDTEVKFKMNTGLFIPIVYKVQENKELSFPKEIDCIARKDIFELKGIKDDCWYELNQDSNLDLLTLGIRKDLERIILPYFGKFSTIDQVIKGIYEKEINPEGASTFGILLAINGQRDEAKKIFERQYKKSKGVQKAIIRRIAKTFNIELVLST